MFSKHIDSHVKPYRYKESFYVTKRFSSATCKLRHERKTHDKYNYEKKLHLCAFLECDRSISRNNFSRHWNRSNHIKRVHNYDEATSFNKSKLFTISSTNSFDQNTSTLASRKRRTSNTF